MESVSAVSYFCVISQAITEKTSRGIRHTRSLGPLRQLPERASPWASAMPSRRVGNDRKMLPSAKRSGDSSMKPSATRLRGGTGFLCTRLSSQKANKDDLTWLLLGNQPSVLEHSDYFFKRLHRYCQ